MLRKISNSALPLPNNQCAFKATDDKGHGSFISILCAETGTTQRVISSFEKTSCIDAMTVMDDKFLISCERSGHIFKYDLEQKSPEEKPQCIFNWKTEQLPGPAASLHYIPETRQLISLHSHVNATQVAVWDMEQQKCLKINLAKEFYFPITCMLTPHELLMVTVSDTTNKAKFTSLNLVTLDLKQLFERNNTGLVCNVIAKQNDVLTWLEVDKDFSKEKVVRRSIKNGRDEVLAESNPLPDTNGTHALLFKSSPGIMSKRIRSMTNTSDGYAIFTEDGLVRLYSEQKQITQTVKLNPAIFTFTTHLCWNPYEKAVLYCHEDQLGSVPVTAKICEKGKAQCSLGAK